MIACTPRALLIALMIPLWPLSAGCENSFCRVVTDEKGTQSLVCPDGSTAPLGGKNALVRLDGEPVGAHCVHGGTAIHSGLDTDGNGVLADSEVTSTQYVCNGGGDLLSGTLDDSYTIHSAVDAALIADVTVITGSLTVQGPGLIDLALPKLTRIDKDFVVDGNTQLASLTLPALTTIGGSFTLSNHAVLTAIALPALTSVAGTIDVRSNANLKNLGGVASLHTVGGTLYVRANPMLTDLTGLAAVTSANALDVSQSDRLVSLAGLSGMTALPGGLRIADNALLGTLTGLHPVTTGLLRIDNNTALTSLAGLESLTAADGVQIDDDIALTSLTALSALTSTQGLAIDGDTALPSLAGLEHITSLVGDLSIQSNASLTTLSPLSAITSARSLYVSANAKLSALSLSSLTSVALNFSITDHPLLRACLVDALLMQLVATPGQVTTTGNAGSGTCP